MLKVYADLGAKSDKHDEVVCVACSIFKLIPYKQFVRPWNRMLKGWNASAFHATDFYVGADEFERKTEDRKELFQVDSKRIPGMIAPHIERALSIAFRPREFMEVVPKYWIDHFGDSVHSHSMQLCLLANGVWAEKHRSSERFAYFVEAGDKDEAEVGKTVAAMRKHPATEKLIRVNSYTAVEKGTARGLETADFLAWHWNKHYMEKVRYDKNDQPRKDFEAFVKLARGKSKEMFLTGSNLREFLAFFPKEGEYDSK